MKPAWWVRLHNPGSLLWWPGYLAWKWFRLCWTAHPLRRVGRHSECSQFWGAEADLFDVRRHPEHWESAELTVLPRACVYGNTFTTSGGIVTTGTVVKANGYILTCLCGGHK